VITVGSESGTPWKGFGSDRFDRYFGTDPRSDHEIVQVAGAAELRSLDETLVLNGQLLSIVGTSSVTKTGKGAVALNNQNNNFRAPITVHEGKLLVNGFISGVTDLSVERDAVLGGTGVIDGPVAVRDGGIIAPGDNTLRGHIGTLQVASLTMSPDSQLEFELNDEAGLNDLLEIRGDLTLDGVLNLFDAGDFAPGDYTLLSFEGNLIDNGLELGFVPDDGLEYSLHVVQVDRAPTGGTLALTVTVPEPGSLTALGVALGAISMRHRRRRIQL
jgi:autotransporter-associated beta strand protein